MDILRKLIHMSMGLFALSLRWLNPWQAMLFALLAFLHNLYIFPLYGRKKLEKEEEKKRGYTAIVSYPAVVFVLIGLATILSWPDKKAAMAIAAAAWGILAFGDAFGAIVGRTVKGPKLPWNGGKTWSGLLGFILFGFISSCIFFYFVISSHPAFSKNEALFIFSCFVATSLAAIVESLDGQFDDNLGFPLVAISILSTIYWCGEKIVYGPISASILRVLYYNESFNPILAVLVINITLAFTALIKKWVSLWGFIFGLLIGFSVIFSLGVKGFAILCLFYLFANFSTFYGKKIKEKRGIAEGNKGTRGLESIFSKGLAPAVFCWLSFEAFVVALAFYAADTVATEFGKTSTRGAFLLSANKIVPQGTVGAISLKGTIAGILSILVFVMVSILDFKSLSFNNTEFFVLSFSTIYFFITESIINEGNFKRCLTSKTVIHVTLGFLAGAVANGIYVFLWMTK